jgi:hypothetical protein
MAISSEDGNDGFDLEDNTTLIEVNERIEEAYSNTDEILEPSDVEGDLRIEYIMCSFDATQFDYNPRFEIR